MKRAFSILFFIIAGINLHAQTLSWDIKFLAGENWESIPINRRINMEEGMNFLLIITPASDCFCYAVVNDSERQIAVVYNGEIRSGDEMSLGPFMVAGEPGTDTLYIIMSLKRQERLDSLIQGFNENPGSTQLADNLRMEVFALQAAAAALGEPPHAFIAGGGTSRGGQEDFVNRYTDKEMYVRPILIRH